MRKWINLFETFSIDVFPRRTIHAGTRLWHGSNTDGDRQYPDGPAWFAFIKEKGEEWAGWTTPSTNRILGERRLYEYVLTTSVEVLDLDSIPEDNTGIGWAKFCEMVTGTYEELGPWMVANELVGKTSGWVGTTGNPEIMLTDPKLVLKYIGMEYLGER